MTNGKKFKTTDERIEGFDKFCKCMDCEHCPCKGKIHGSVQKCSLVWLDLEYKEELKTCPFCGGEAMKRKSNRVYYVFCTNCSVKTVDSITPDGAIAAWNRRV
jgi:Lar family restriction alleviation protein